MIYDCTIFFFSPCFLMFYAQHWHFEWRFGFVLFMRVYDGSIRIVWLSVLFFFGSFLYIMKERDI